MAHSVVNLEVDVSTGINHVEYNNSIKYLSFKLLDLDQEILKKRLIDKTNLASWWWISSPQLQSVIISDTCWIIIMIISVTDHGMLDKHGKDWSIDKFLILFIINLVQKYSQAQKQ